MHLPQSKNLNKPTIMPTLIFAWLESIISKQWLPLIKSIISNLYLVLSRTGKVYQFNEFFTTFLPSFCKFKSLIIKSLMCKKNSLSNDNLHCENKAPILCAPSGLLRELKLVLQLCLLTTIFYSIENDLQKKKIIRV